MGTSPNAFEKDDLHFALCGLSGAIFFVDNVLRVFPLKCGPTAVCSRVASAASPFFYLGLPLRAVVGVRVDAAIKSLISFSRALRC